MELTPVTQPSPRLDGGRPIVQPHFEPYPDTWTVTPVEPPKAPLAIRSGPGLVYVHRDGLGVTHLDRGNYYQRKYPRVPEPERTILRTLLTHALRELDAMDADDDGAGTVRG